MTMSESLPDDRSVPYLSAADLLDGGEAIIDVTLPDHVLLPTLGSAAAPVGTATVQLRPITIGTFQLIMRAARNDAELIPLLMIKESLVQPELTLEQCKRLHLGLIDHLIDAIREISGLSKKK